MRQSIQTTVWKSCGLKGRGNQVGSSRIVFTKLIPEMVLRQIHLAHIVIKKIFELGLT